MSVDSGADDHVCPLSFASWLPAEPRWHAAKAEGKDNLYDAQGALLKDGGTRTVPLLLGPEGQRAKVTFRVTTVRNPILSLGKLLREGFEFSLKSDSLVMKKGTRVFRNRHNVLKGGPLQLGSAAHITLRSHYQV